MFRTARSTAGLVRALVIGSGSVLAAPGAGLVATATLASTLTACGPSEDQPEFWLPKLEERKYRKKAVEKLLQMYENREHKASSAKKPEDKKEADASLEDFVSKVKDPLTKIYVKEYSTLEVGQRVDLLKFLVGLGDKAVVPAIEKAFDEYIKKPPTKTSDAQEQDLKYALRGVLRMKLVDLAPKLLEAMKKTDANVPLGKSMMKDLREPMMMVAKDPAGEKWVGPLHQVIGEQYPHLRQPKNPNEANSPAYREKKADYLREIKKLGYQQVLSCDLLGVIGKAESVEPLMKVLLDPEKGARFDQGQPTAVNQSLLAMVQIGKPAMDRALKVLSGEDKDLVNYNIERVMKARELEKPPEKEKPWAEMAASLLGALGRKDAEPKMIEIMQEKDQDLKVKVTIALQLALLPPTKESMDAYLALMKELKLSDRADGDMVLPPLIQSSTNFFESSFVASLEEVGNGLEGQKFERTGAYYQLVSAMVTLATPEQMEQVEKAFLDWESKGEFDYDTLREIKKSMEQAKFVLDKCKKDVSCYIGLAADQQNQMPIKKAVKVDEKDKKNPKYSKIEITDQEKSAGGFVGIKAAFMVGIFGEEKHVPELMKKLDDITGNPRGVVAKVIDKLSPGGSKEVADQLEKMIEDARASGDMQSIQRNEIFEQVVYRLRAKAGS